MILALGFWAALIGTCVYAFLRGGRPERIGAAVNVLGCLATLVVRLALASAWLPAAATVLLIDLAVAACFFWLAIRTIRFWPIWACGFAVANILMSIMAAVVPHVALFAYHTGLGIYGYLALGALALGTFGLRDSVEPAVRDGFRRRRAVETRSTILFGSNRKRVAPVPSALKSLRPSSLIGFGSSITRHLVD